MVKMGSGELRTNFTTKEEMIVVKNQMRIAGTCFLKLDIFQTIGYDKI